MKVGPVNVPEAHLIKASTTARTMNQGTARREWRLPAKVRAWWPSSSRHVTSRRWDLALLALLLHLPSSKAWWCTGSTTRWPWHVLFLRDPRRVQSEPVLTLLCLRSSYSDDWLLQLFFSVQYFLVSTKSLSCFCLERTSEWRWDQRKHNVTVAVAVSTVLVVMRQLSVGTSLSMSSLFLGVTKAPQKIASKMCVDRCHKQPRARRGH